MRIAQWFEQYTGNFHGVGSDLTSAYICGMLVVAFRHMSQVWLVPRLNNSTEEQQVFYNGQTNLEIVSQHRIQLIQGIQKGLIDLKTACNGSHPTMCAVTLGLYILYLIKPIILDFILHRCPDESSRCYTSDLFNRFPSTPC